MLTRNGYYPLSDERQIWIGSIRDALHICYSDKVFLTPSYLLVIADDYLHINLEKLKQTFKEKGYDVEYSRAYKDRNNKMRYEFKIKEMR